MKGKRIIITGISGVNIGESIKKFKNYCIENHKEDFEDYYINEVIHEIEKEKTNNHNLRWYEILEYPYIKLRNLWNEAFEKISEKIKENESKNIILVIHSSYFHQDTQEFISFSNLNKLRLSFRPDKIITLIDDIGDIHLRLKESDQIYSPEYLGAEKEEIKNIFELLEILQWRAHEIVLSRCFADYLEKPPFIFATKHPLETFYRLLFEEEKYLKIYLSHPITKIRKLLFGRKIQKAEKEIEPIAQITKTLSEKCICFFPTTIDELRFNEKNHSSRWQEDFYKNKANILYTPPIMNDYLPYSKKRFNERLKLKRKEEFQISLKHLFYVINRQVGVRDKMMVEQSDMLIVYRPYLGGYLSGGVEQEIKYLKKLKPSKNKKLGIIYFPDEDYNDTKIEQIVINILDFLDERNGFVLKDKKISKDKKKKESFKQKIVNKYRDSLLNNFENSYTLAKTIKEVIVYLLGEGLIKKDGSFQIKTLDSQISGKLDKNYQELANNIKKIYEDKIRNLKQLFYMCNQLYDINSYVQKLIKNRNN